MDWIDEDPGTCMTCGEKWQLIRPGKSQPLCDCDLICEHCGEKTIKYHHEPNPRWPNFSGYFCSQCGPLPAPKEVKP